MPVLFLNWGALAPFGGVLTGTQNVDAGGIDVGITVPGTTDGEISVTSSEDGSGARSGLFAPNASLKLVSEGAAPASQGNVSTAQITFAAKDPLFGDSVQNVVFRIHDKEGAEIHAATEASAASIEDRVSIRAWDAAGDLVAVTLTPGRDKAADAATATGSGEYAQTASDGGVLVEIAGPLARLEIVYETAASGAQSLSLSDIQFETTDAALDAPDSADQADGMPGAPIIVDVLAQDADPKSGASVVTGLTEPTHGTAIVNADHTITYTPDATFAGHDVFTYTRTDPDGAAHTAMVTISAVDGRIDTDVFPVDASLQPLDPLNGNDEDPDPNDGRDAVTGTSTADMIETGDDADTIIGRGGDDTILPGIDDDVVEGRGGDDFISDLQGADTLNGGAGDDTIIAGANTFSDYPDQGGLPLPPGLGFDRDPNPEEDRDLVTGGGGDDSIVTGDDSDTVNAGNGDDFVDAGIDDDSILGGRGNDTLIGGHGADTVDGGQGDDVINTSNPDILEAIDDNGLLGDAVPGNDRDVVRGGRGDDTIFTGDDADTIAGNAGDDVINSGIDDDSILGNGGADTILSGQGSDFVDGGAGDDLIDARTSFNRALPDNIDPFPQEDRDTVLGGGGADTILTGDDDDIVDGGTGNDVIDVGIDNDRVDGGAGADFLFGGAGSDTLDGGSGDDTLVGGADADTILGGADRDTILISSVEEGRGDDVDGGSGGDDFDRLDITGLGARGTDWRVVDQTSDSNGNGIDGTVQTLNTTTGAFEDLFNFSEIEEIVPCFTPGTTIATPTGARRVEELREGDRVITRDNGLQEIVWIGQKSLTPHHLARAPHLSPIVIRAGSLRPNVPEHDMHVSPQHRMLVCNDRNALYFDDREVLVAAKHLTERAGIDEVGPRQVTYVHFMCAHHEVVLSNGLWTESFQPGPTTLSGMGRAQRGEIFELFPELQSRDGLNSYGAARRSLKKHEARLIARAP